jgi:hypothetical protein
MDDKHESSAHIDTLDNPTCDVIQLATNADTSKDSPWSLSMFRLYAVLALAYLCGCLNGYDGSLMGAINAFPQYQKYFGM